MKMSDSESELNASELGTKEYWDDVYKTDKQNFDDNMGEAGEIWFGLSTLRLIIKYISSVANASDEVIDLGCGNGMLLIELGQSGFTKLFGVDYSENAIELAASVAKSKKCSAQFDVRDLVNWADPVGSYKIAVDKGTYDAISLDPDNAVAKRKAYLDNVSKIIAQNGLLILTTCNWSETEIIDQISKVPALQFKEKLPAPEFKFGGKSGSRVTTVVFEKTG